MASTYFYWPSLLLEQWFVLGGSKMRSCDDCWALNGEFVTATMRIPVGSSGFSRYLCTSHYELLEVEQ